MTADGEPPPPRRFSAEFEQSQRTPHVSFLSYAGIVANRIHFSQWFIAFHVAMSLLNLVVVIWCAPSAAAPVLAQVAGSHRVCSLAGRSSADTARACASSRRPDLPRHPARPASPLAPSPLRRPYPRLYLSLEIFIVIMLVLEVVLRMCSMRRSFWRSPCNVFDVIVTALCCVSLVVLLVAPDVSFDMEDAFAFFLVALRYANPWMRLVTWARHQRSLPSAAAGSVDFTRVGGERSGRGASHGSRRAAHRPAARSTPRTRRHSASTCRRRRRARWCWSWWRE